ncbi:hypothetical protein [Mesorhizobium sp. RMAD-H1]|uniref:hypothetical protein n=1 Tax=Mesorhizobium sp. RMAD-H1 TaxID=2587065 RepID=UPI00160B4F82|nr:hypothetical protein [Mesorhizobium sp. RMAD-H1]MBB2969549.1 hypothetical protein [Mesorhizobium sp. RMAD-H1]
MRAKSRHARKGRPSQPAPKTLPDDLYDYCDDSQPKNGPQRAATPILGPHRQRMRVTDDWPEHIPVTEAEIQVFERWFSDVFDELLSPRRSHVGLHILSQSDKKIP